MADKRAEATCPSPTRKASRPTCWKKNPLVSGGGGETPCVLEGRMPVQRRGSGSGESRRRQRQRQQGSPAASAARPDRRSP